MNEYIEYFFAELDFHLKQGENPEQALLKTVKDYAFVFHTNDDRTSFARACTIALKQLEEGIND